MCWKHGTAHLCREDFDCEPDFNGKCLVSGHVIERRADGLDVHNCIINPKPSRIKSEHFTAGKILTQKYTRYSFGEYIRHVLVNKAITVCPIRLNSILQRLYELFAVSKEKDKQKVTLNDTLRVQNCDTRLEHLAAIIEKELLHTNNFSNRDPGAAFRTQAGFLISHDMVCDMDDLMPWSPRFEPQIYVLKNEQKFKGSWKL